MRTVTATLLYPLDYMDLESGIDEEEVIEAPFDLGDDWGDED